MQIGAGFLYTLINLTANLMSASAQLINYLFYNSMLRVLVKRLVVYYLVIHL